ncbi:MAG TPA: hypothetical protein VMU39_17680 [Solirubrobacteraceae bacterium]|nr:hypothetical protein [Solirubrobacteraceae bacterium]
MNALLGLLGTGRDFGARFTLINLLPTGALAIYVLALVWSGAPAHAPDVANIDHHLTNLSAGAATLLVIGLLVVAVILQPLQLALVRLLEGYWGDSGLARAAAARGTAHHERERRQLEQAVVVRGRMPTEAELDRMGDAAARRRLYPTNWSLLPTRLGNVLRASEERAGGRYGLNSIVAWPRLLPLLPDTLRATADDQRTQLDAAARLCVVLILASVIGVCFLAPHPVWLIAPAVTMGLAVVAYKATIAAAIAYGETLEVAFDLHRFDLLRAVCAPLPADTNAELTTNASLSSFWLQGPPPQPEGAPPLFTYEHSGNAAS